jgi:phage shock protein A
MWKVMKRQWKYLTAKLSGNLEARADPKVQLEQAINDAKEQHRRLVEQAANVVARQKQTELQLNRAMGELEKTNASTRQALTLAQEASANGDAAKAAEYNQTAEAFAKRLLDNEKQIEDLKTMALQTAQASVQAKAAVQQNSLQLQDRLAERQKLLSQLDQAKMQEQLNSAMSTLSQSTDHEVPSLEQVRDKIEQRYAKAVGTSELTGTTVESRMLEVQQASLTSAASSRLDEIRAQMGLGAGGGEAIGTGAKVELEKGAPAADKPSVPSAVEADDPA